MKKSIDQNIFKSRSKRYSSIFTYLDSQFKPKIGVADYFSDQNFQKSSEFLRISLLSISLKSVHWKSWNIVLILVFSNFSGRYSKRILKRFPQPFDFFGSKFWIYRWLLVATSDFGVKTKSRYRGPCVECYFFRVPNTIGLNHLWGCTDLESSFDLMILKNPVETKIGLKLKYCKLYIEPMPS